MDNAKVL